VLNNGLQLLGTGQDLVQMIKGLVLLAAVGIDVYSKQRGGLSIIARFSRNRDSGGSAGTTSPTENSPQANNPASADTP